MEFSHLSDNGKGMEKDTLASGKTGHFGLKGMRERAARTGAKLTITSSPAGTKIALSVPGEAIFECLHILTGINLFSPENHLEKSTVDTLQFESCSSGLAALNMERAHSS